MDFETDSDRRGGLAVSSVALDREGLRGRVGEKALAIAAARLGRCRALSLEGNQLSGPVPAALGLFVSLQELRLRLNQFSGELPDSLGQLAALRSLNLSENNISGRIPASFSGLTSLTALDLSRNRLSGDLPGRSFGGMRALRCLSLQTNDFTGRPPIELTRLERLRLLSLEGNDFTLPRGSGLTNEQGGGGGLSCSRPADVRQLMAALFQMPARR